MIQLVRPDIRKSDIEKVIAVLKSGHLVQGQLALAFEKKLSQLTDIPYCLTVSSGTAALHLALLALDFSPDDWAIVPAFTFPATANVVEIIGGKVILCDVDPKTYVVSPQAIEQTILKNKGRKIKAILIVHEFGYPAQMKKIAQMAKKYKIALVEDAACALGTISSGRHTGFYSDMACFSFHPRKAVTTGEGGFVATKNKDLAQKIQILRNHGIQKKDGEIDFIAAGLNYRLTDFQIALALGQLTRFPSVIKKRRKLAQIYQQNLKNISGLELPQPDPGHSWQSYMIVLDQNIDRQKIIKKMRKRGIQTNLGAQALNCLSYYKNKYHLKDSDFPVAETLYKKGLVLPLYHQLKMKDINQITTQFKKVLNETSPKN